MRDIKNDIKSAVYYAVRDIRSRPREAVTLVAIMTAIMLTLVLLLLWLEADWRADVIPEHEENYHMVFRGLTYSEKEIIRGKEWVQATYDVATDSGSGENSEFRVRIKWEYLNENPVTYIKEIWDEFNLKNSTEYSYGYWNSYNGYYDKYSTGGGNNPLLFFQKINSSPEDAAREGAERNTFENIRNRAYCTKTTQSYMIMPDNLLTIVMFTFFLGGVVFILTNERYKRNLSESGSLRAVGFAKWQMYVYYVARGVMIACAALLPAALTSSLAVLIYGAVTKSIADDASYLVISESVPISNIIVTFLCLFVMTAAANILVCFSYRYYSVMDGLRGRETLEIAYVETSSERFEDAVGDLAYTSLYQARTKRRMLTNAVAVAVMVPLPVFYLSLSSVITGDVTAIESALFAFQSIILTVAAAAVIALSVVYTIRGRRAELSMLRAMGMSRSRIARTVIVSALYEGVAASVMSGLTSSFIYLYMSSNMSSAYSAAEPFTGDRNLPMFIIELVINAFKLMPTAALLVLVSELIGAMLGLAIYLRGSIIEGVRRAD